jgi:DNA polymerase III subunit chi
MPRADFYLISKPRFLEKPLLLVCELARKAIAANQPMLILANSVQQAEIIDDLLWEFDPDEFLPHQIVGIEDDEDICPILICAPEHDVPMRPLVLNLRNTPAQGNVERVLEVVPADANSRGPLRERWKHYQAQGYEVNKYDM